jgi:CRISPR-associated protein Cmr6
MILDVPYIPASSVKGLLRSYLLRRCSELGNQSDRQDCARVVIEVFGASEGPVARGEERDWFVKSFGGSPEAKKAAAGLVFLSDAYLVEPVCDGSAIGGLLVPDVLTSHYYRGGRVACEELTEGGRACDEFAAAPVPVLHLSIPAGSVFRLVIGVDPSAKGSLDPLVRYLSGGRYSSTNPGLAMASILKAALEEEGLGGRTTKGYGRLEIDKFTLKCNGQGRPRRRPAALRFKERGMGRG